MKYRKATAEMVNMVKKIARKCHRHLDNCNIAVLCQEKASKSKGKTVLATAARPTAKLKPILDGDYEFVICIAEDMWIRATPQQREAVVDHELCHCGTDEEGEAFLRPHDYEEFAEIIDRHGFWRKDFAEHQLQKVLKLNTEPTGKIDTLKSAVGE